MLTLGDELALYLASEGLKPAAWVTLDPLLLYPPVDIKELFPKFHGSLPPIPPYHGIYNDEWKMITSLQVHKTEEKTFKSYLQQSGFLYFQSPDLQFYQVFSGRDPILVGGIIFKFMIGTNEKNLQKFKDAKTDGEIGLALGYPYEAVEAYVQNRKPDMSKHISDAIKAGIEIPRWLAYIFHIPESIDLVNGKISVSSRLLGESYQKLVKAKNPELAERVEKSFFDIFIKCDGRDLNPGHNVGNVVY